MSFTARRVGRMMLVVLAVMLQACASVPNAKGSDPRDPWEPMNRRVYNFNEALDRIAIRPAAVAYEAVVPRPVRTGVHNFLSNLGEVWTLANSAMQLKVQGTVETLMRIQINTFFGLGGILDVATEMRLPKRKEDFGQTLGYWGVKPGPYVVLPVLGPSTVRDSLSLPVDMAADLSLQIQDTATRNALTVTGILDVRANLLQTIDAVKAAALDPYTFVRDGYLQKRLNDIHDGFPPSQFDYSDMDTP